MELLISMDDTDNLDSRGTGYRARYLGRRLTETGRAQVEGITRHQLLIDPRIPYTSHNSAACLVVETGQTPFDEMVDYCRNFLLQESVPGSDAGLCLLSWETVGPTVQEFGHRAKQEVLTQTAAIELARHQNIYLEGLTGDGQGVIGALAAVGLRATGQDGRFIWLPGVRELQGVHTAKHLLRAYHIDKITSIDYIPVSPEARIDVGEWRRPILKDHQAVLLVEMATDDQQCDWRVIPKEMVKRLG